jgi:hypothetical protein
LKTAGAAGLAAIGFFLPEGSDPVEPFVQGRVAELRLAFDSSGAAP